MVVGDSAYGWAFGHRHDRVPGYPGCASVLTLWRIEGGTLLRLVFRPDAERVIADGYFEEGTVLRLPDRACLSLHEPGSVRALLDVAVAQGLFPRTGKVEADGWPLFDVVRPPVVSG